MRIYEQKLYRGGSIMELTCKQIVEKLDEYIIGQDEAKRAVAIALRNRYRRSKLPAELKSEITPKNIILKGPTGVGKTEIARRLAKLVNAPFVKVEATKYTEVGYVGRDVESMVRDLVEVSYRLVKEEQSKLVKDKAILAVNKKIKDILYPLKKANKPESMDTESFKIDFENKFLAGEFDADVIDVEVKEQPKQIDILSAGGGEFNIGQIVGGMLGGMTKIKKLSVKKAREMLLEEECDKLLDQDNLSREAITRAEQDGIIFIDEIDKIVNKKTNGQDVSREGVQRDILPIVEGSVVSTKYGVVHTDYILFIAAGAFHVADINDLIPELQGRFPIRVELHSLKKEEFYKILTVPQNALTKQYQEMLAVDNIDLHFTDDALMEIAQMAETENETNENIGARRLQTLLENLMEDISFNASNENPLVKVEINEEYVKQNMKGVLKELDFNKYIL